MDSSTVGSIICLALLVLASAFFSASETAFSSLNMIRIKSMANNSNKRAQLVLSLAERYDKLLSTILVGNNIVNITAASMATVLFVRFWGDVGATIATIVTTVTLLIFGEIAPKSMAKETPESFALATAGILRAVVVVFTPINYVFGLWANLMARVARPKEKRKLTGDELIAMLEQAEEQGAINEQDTELIQSAIDFNDGIVTDILTPRVDVEGVPLDATKDEILKTYIDSGYTRLAVYDETLDDIVGTLHMKDFFIAVIQEKEIHITDMLNPVTFVSPTLKIAELFKKLQQAKTHLAVVTDEYGGTVGIVTLEDVLEELVGEIWDEHDEVTEDYVKTADHIYLVRGAVSCDEMLAHFGIHAKSDATTVSGFIMEQLGKIPEVGDSFELDGYKIIVTQIEHRRIIECMIALPNGMEM